MSTCRVFSCVGRGCLLWPVRSLGRTLLAFALLHSLSKVKFACYSKCFLTSYFCFPVPYNEKDICFWTLILEGLARLHRTIQLQLLQHYWLGHSLRLLCYWMVCLGSEQRSFCHIWDCTHVLHFSDSFVDYEGYSISSKGFLPTVVDIIVIWVKFTHSSPF